MSNDGETVIFQTSPERRIFCSTSVRLWVKPRWDMNTKDHQENPETRPKEFLYRCHAIKRTPSEVPGRSNSGENHRAEEYGKSRNQELGGLVSNGTFYQVQIEEVPYGNRLFDFGS